MAYRLYVVQWVQQCCPPVWESSCCSVHKAVCLSWSSVRDRVPKQALMPVKERALQPEWRQAGKVSITNVLYTQAEGMAQIKGRLFCFKTSGFKAGLPTPYELIKTIKSLPGKPSYLGFSSSQMQSSWQPRASTTTSFFTVLANCSVWRFKTELPPPPPNLLGFWSHLLYFERELAIL